jgi:hypothetical protein
LHARWHSLLSMHCYRSLIARIPFINSLQMQLFPWKLVHIFQAL